MSEILQLYEQASGQKINKEKSAITFSKLAPEELKDRVRNELQITKEGGAGKYLGLPEHFGRKKKDLFTGMVEKLGKKRLDGQLRCYLQREKW